MYIQSTTISYNESTWLKSVGYMGDFIDCGANGGEVGVGTNIIRIIFLIIQQ